VFSHVLGIGRQIPSGNDGADFADAAQYLS
jgi:hypothetical protein